IQHASFEAGVGIYPTVPQKWPVRSMTVDPLPFHLAGNNFFLVDGTLGDDLAVRAAQKTLTPEFNPVTTGGRFVPDPIGCRHIAAVGNRVPALNCFPRSMLGTAKLRFFPGMPAD